MRENLVPRVRPDPPTCRLGAVKRGDLIRHLEAQGCVFGREGGNHTIYKNPKKGLSTGVPRHTEVDNLLARKICKELGIRRPPGA